MAYQLKDEAIAAKQKLAMRPVPRCGVRAKWWMPNWARSIVAGMASQTKRAVDQAGRARRRRWDMAPMTPAAKMAKTASTRPARMASKRPARRLVAKKVEARRRALSEADFQLHMGMRVRRG